MNSNGENGNGQGDEGRPVVIKFETQTGVILHINPMNLATLRAIELKAQDMFPYPNPEPYRQPLENTFGDTELKDNADDNPEYKVLKLEVDRKRMHWKDMAIFNYAVKFPKYPNRDSFIEAFRPRLLELKAIAKIDEDMSEYEQVLNYIVLTWNEVESRRDGLVVGATEFAKIIRLAVQAVALTPEEVSNGVRFFRANL